MTQSFSLISGPSGTGFLTQSSILHAVATGDKFHLSDYCEVYTVTKECAVDP